MVRTLRLLTIHERRDYFLCILMFKCIHGLAPHYLCKDVTMYVDINGYDTRSAENMDLYLPCCSREIYKRSFLYKGSSLWNQLLPCLKESTSIVDFKRNYTLLYGWRLLYGVVLYIINIYVCIYVSFFVCIFYSVTGHHGRTVWLNGPPCMNILEMKIK